MKDRHIRVFWGVLIGSLVLATGVWKLMHSLDNFTPIYRGQPVAAWREQLQSKDSAVSNQAYSIVASEIVPQLIDRMFHDTNDSKFQVTAVNLLNSLPGIQIKFIDANGRRAQAACALGNLGPAAKSTIPQLVQALHGPDPFVRESAIYSLGVMRSEPDFVIPLLLGLLDDKELNADAATALAKFGGLSEAAVPKLMVMLRSPDKDERHAAQQALILIDPVAAKKAHLREMKMAN